MGACGASKRYSWFAAAAGWFAGVVKGLSYNHVLATSKSAPEATASREANLGTASHVLAISDNSLSPAAMPEITAPSPYYHSDSELPRSPRWRIPPLLSASASAGPVRPILPTGAPRAPALRSSPGYQARGSLFPLT